MGHFRPVLEQGCTLSRSLHIIIVKVKMRVLKLHFLLVRKKSVFNHIKHISFQVLRKMLLENLLKWLFFIFYFFYSVYNETIHVHKSYLFKTQKWLLML